MLSEQKRGSRPPITKAEGRQFVGCSTFLFGLYELPPVAKLHENQPFYVCLLAQFNNSHRSCRHQLGRRLYGLTIGLITERKQLR
jgi:hypothetical protein